ncbi:hypothetical protein GWI33_016309 [Rhynchophorus ferrugineus]|uniref:Uncharacterized protein n=1 Tax=Rhynchophorus ferrugineus TaxID=354439 RepID=A0A834I1X8_RHYFE|nr:hypothetical protein GWI33_016309 [Rhynchophorus ferrugineus]
MAYHDDCSCMEDSYEDEPSHGILPASSTESDANTILLDYLGHEAPWNVSRGISFMEYEHRQNISDISSPSYYHSLRDSEPSDVSLTRAPPDLNYSPEPESDYEQICDISCPEMESSYEHIDDISAPQFESTGLDSSASEAVSATENPSNISVYDAEQLNKTTAPRSSDISIPRNRIWTSMLTALTYMEEEEEERYNSFVRGLHEERREQESSYLSS